MFLFYTYVKAIGARRFRFDWCHGRDLDDRENITLDAFVFLK